MESSLAHVRPEYVTDLKKVEVLAQKKSQENFEFAQWIKTQNPEKIDALVKEISTEVMRRVDCTQCAKCCSALVVAPDYRDISDLASHLQMPTLDFKKKYMKKDQEGDMVFKQKPCPFLKNKKCSVYVSRPQLCRNYPYLDQGQFIATINRVLRNLHVCPIAYNSFEVLKSHFA